MCQCYKPVTSKFLAGFRTNGPWTNGPWDKWALGQMGPGQMGPGQIDTRQMGTGQMGPGQMGPGTNGPIRLTITSTVFLKVVFFLLLNLITLLACL